jgi:hypothetical protein
MKNDRVEYQTFKGTWNAFDEALREVGTQGFFLRQFQVVEYTVYAVFDRVDWGSDE